MTAYLYWLCDVWHWSAVYMAQLGTALAMLAAWPMRGCRSLVTQPYRVASAVLAAQRTSGWRSLLTDPPCNAVAVPETL